jgi:hypothetical protein
MSLKVFIPLLFCVLAQGVQVGDHSHTDPWWDPMGLAGPEAPPCEEALTKYAENGLCLQLSEGWMTAEDMANAVNAKRSRAECKAQVVEAFCAAESNTNRGTQSMGLGVVEQSSFWCSLYKAKSQQYPSPHDAVCHVMASEGLTPEQTAQKINHMKIGSHCAAGHVEALACPGTMARFANMLPSWN